MAILGARWGAVAAVLAGAIASAAPAAGQTAVRFSLGYRIEGPTAPFLVALDRGYFKAEGLDVTIEPAGGSLVPITRVASGRYDMGFGDINSLIRFRDQNPGTPIKPVFMVYNRPPFAIISRRSRGVQAPKDLEGKKLGAHANGAAFAQWPVFAHITGIDVGKVTVETIGYAVREPMLAAGQVDAVTGFTFSTYVSLKDRRVPLDDIVVMPMADYGMELYGNAIMVGPKFAAESPAAVRGFLRAFLKALKETVRHPGAAIESVLARNEAAKKEVELERLKMAIRNNIVTPEVRANGYGGVDPERFDRAVAQIAATYDFGAKPKAADIFDPSFLPPAAERKVN